MYDKTVRRRRAVLALLVVCSVILLTVYFGESAGGGLHAVQRGFLEVVSPIQDGASRALKPVRDLFGWVGDTLDAQGQRDKLQKELAATRRAAIANAGAAREVVQLRKLVRLDGTASLEQMGPVSARVISRSPTVWYSTVIVDQGSGDGVRRGNPVVTGDGLIGTVTAVTGDSSVVTLITDHTSGVSAKIVQSGVSGVVQPAVGNPNDLLLEYTHRDDRVRVGQTIVTAGSSSPRLPSKFPPDIPIGRVTKVDGAPGAITGVHLRPFAQLRRLDVVQVLTKPDVAAVS